MNTNTRPEWASAEEAKLRSIVDEIKRGGAAIAEHDATTAKQREMQEEVRAFVQRLENPVKWPTGEDALALVKSQALHAQMSAFLSDADARRAALVSKVMEAIKRLATRLEQLTERPVNFAHPNPAFLSTIHQLCHAELEKALAGDYETTNEGGMVNIWTTNTICVP